MPKISNVLLKLQRFQWAIALDLNVGFYTIRLDADSSKIFIIIIMPWGVPIFVEGSPDIFQSKMSNLISRVCMSEDSFEDYLEKFKEVVAKLL